MHFPPFDATSCPDETLAVGQRWRDHQRLKRRRRMTIGSGDVDPSQPQGSAVPARTSPAPLNQVTFSRRELNRILDLYGRMVAAGEWRDYAIDFLDEVAVFSIFRRSSEMPLYRVEKRPELRAKQGMFAVIDAGGRILKRGHELDSVLRVFDKKLLKALSAD
jgi:Protein of unknown function (DUF2794)